MFTSIKRIIGLGWHNLSRDGGIAIANIFIIMIPILLTSLLFEMKDVSAFLIREFQSKADISVYFNESVSENDILRVKDKINQIPGIENVQYVSKDQALEDFKIRHQNDAVLLESLNEINGNPLVSLLNVSAVSTVKFDEVSALLAQDEYKDMVNRVNYNEKKEVIQKIFAITENTKKVGLVLFAILGFISVIVTYNTIRTAILSRGREIAIQRLVGASRWFVRGQFLVEGLIFGILGAVFSFLIAAVICWYLSPMLAAILPGMSLWQNFLTGIWTLIGIQIGIGAGLGIFSSMIAITRYLKV
ncbi:MAG: permease-like cell division protein FtsX [Minisyncoccales bacterium]